MNFEFLVLRPVFLSQSTIRVFHYTLVTKFDIHDRNSLSPYFLFLGELIIFDPASCVLGGGLESLSTDNLSVPIPSNTKKVPWIVDFENYGQVRMYDVLLNLKFRFGRRGRP